MVKKKINSTYGIYLRIHDTLYHMEDIICFEDNPGCLKDKTNGILVGNNFLCEMINRYILEEYEDFKDSLIINCQLLPNINIHKPYEKIYILSNGRYISIQRWLLAKNGTRHRRENTSVEYFVSENISQIGLLMCSDSERFTTVKTLPIFKIYPNSDIITNYNEYAIRKLES